MFFLLVRGVRSVLGQSCPAGFPRAGLVARAIGPLNDLITLCSGKQQQQDSQVIQSDLMEHTALWPKFKNSNEASSLEGIGKYFPASQITHAPKWMLTQTQFPRFGIDGASRIYVAGSKRLNEHQPSLQHHNTWSALLCFINKTCASQLRLETPCRTQCLPSHVESASSSIKLHSHGN